MIINEFEFCKNLAKKFPDIASILAEHLSDYDKLLPYVFLADVTRYVLANEQSRKLVVEHLESMFATGRAAVENLIALSFVQNLENEDDLNCAMKGAQAPRLRAEWIRQRMS